MVLNGKPNREWLSREGTSSPMASLEDVFLTEKTGLYEGRDTMVLDGNNAFIQTTITSNKYGEERVIIKITGVIVDMIVKLNLEGEATNLI